MIPDAAVEAAALKLAMLNSDAGDQLTDREHATQILEAAAPHMLAGAQAQAWEHCAKKAEAATKLAAPDHITPMGARVIRQSLEPNPYRPTP